jgi:hypothetical protein
MYWNQITPPKQGTLLGGGFDDHPDFFDSPQSATYLEVTALFATNG